MPTTIDELLARASNASMQVFGARQAENAAWRAVQAVVDPEGTTGDQGWGGLDLPPPTIVVRGRIQQLDKKRVVEGGRSETFEVFAASPTEAEKAVQYRLSDGNLRPGWPKVESVEGVHPAVPAMQGRSWFEWHELD